MTTSLGTVEGANWSENSVFATAFGQVVLTSTANSDIGNLIYTAGALGTEGVLRVSVQIFTNTSGTLSVGYIDAAASTSTATAITAVASFYGFGDNPNSGANSYYAGVATASTHWPGLSTSWVDVWVSYCISGGVLTMKLYVGSLTATGLVARVTGTAPAFSTMHPVIGAAGGGSFAISGGVQGTPTWEQDPASYPISNLYAYELDSSVMITWDEHPLANSYDYRVNGGTPVSVTNSAAPEATITSLTNGTTYTIEVRPVAQSGNGAWASITARPSTVLLWDKFNRADSATSIGTPDSGGPYTVQAGTWGINTNRAYPAVSATREHVTAPGAADIDITFTPAASISTFHGIVFRWQDASNYLLLTVNTSGNTIQLQKVVATTVSTSATFGYPTAVNDKIRLIAKSRQIWVYANGKEIGYFESSLYLTSTAFGLYAGSLTTARFDNLLAKAPPTDPTLGKDGSTSWVNLGGLISTSDTAGSP